jgi:hypothetical protein
MSRVALSFKLPEEQEDFKLAINGVSYYLVLSDLKDWLRHKRKYEDIEILTIEEVEAKVYELLNERSIAGDF